MKQRRFALGLGLLGAALAWLGLGLAVEREAFFDTLAGGIAYLVIWSALQLAGVGLLWSDVGKRPLRWLIAVPATLLVVMFFLVLAHGPG